MATQPKKRQAHRTAPSQSEQILGRPMDASGPGTAAELPGIPPNLQPFHKQLLDLRDHVLSQVAHMRDQASGYEAKDLMQADAESATDEADRDFGFGMATNYQQVLSEIEAALDRIRDGTYGRCELTGKPIPQARLRAVPWTRYTAEAEQQLEAQGQSPVPKGLPRPEMDFGLGLHPRTDSKEDGTDRTPATTEKAPADADTEPDPKTDPREPDDTEE